MKFTSISFIILSGIIVIICISLFVPYNTYELFEDDSDVLNQLQKCTTSLNTSTVNNQSLQASNSTIIQDASNNKINWLKCQSDSQELQNKIDTMNKSYNNLQGQMNSTNQTNLASNFQTTVLQEGVSSCQAQMALGSSSFVTLQEQYNNLISQYQNLQTQYNDLSNQYYVKCFLYNKTLTPVK